MSATLRCNGFLRTLFLAILHLQFSQLVSNNTALELPPSHTHPQSTVLAASFLCTISHPIGPSIQTLLPSPVHFSPFQVYMSQLCCTTASTDGAQYLLDFFSLHSIGMYSVTQHTTRRAYCIAKYLFSFVLTIVGIVRVHPFFPHSRLDASCQHTALYNPSSGCELLSRWTGTPMMHSTCVKKSSQPVPLTYQQGDAKYTSFQ